MLTSEVDSARSNPVLKQDKKATINLHKALDSLNRTTRHAEASVSALRTKVQDSLTRVQKAVTKPADSLLSNVNKKLTKGIGAADTLAEVSDRIQPFQIDGLKETGSPVNIPVEGQLQLPGNIAADGPLMPSLPESYPGVDIPSVSDLNTTTLPDIKSNVADVSKSAEVLKESQEILATPVKVDSAAIAREVENRVLKEEPVAAVNKYFKEADVEQARYQALLQRYRDEKLNREEITRKAKAVVNSQIKEHVNPLNPVQMHLTTAKNKASTFKRLKEDLFSESPELSVRKFSQRLTPGFMWQFNKRDFLFVDVSIQVGYQLNRRFTAGLGGIYRVGIGDQMKGWIQELDVFGGRIFVDGNIGKGAFLHGEFEALRVLDTSPLIKPGVETAPNRVYGSYFGLGKRINVARRIAFVAQANYRVDYINELNKASKVSARFGVEYVFRRPRRDLAGIKK